MELVQVGLFEVFKLDPSIIHVTIFTKAHFECMMRCKGKEVMEENNFLAKVCWKQAPVKGKEIQKMLQWFQMGLKEHEWPIRASLGGLFIVHWTIPWGDLLEEFFVLASLQKMEESKPWYVVRISQLTRCS